MSSDIIGPCVLASFGADASRCTVTIMAPDDRLPTIPNGYLGSTVHTITATFLPTGIHSGSASANGLTVNNVAPVISAGSPTGPAGPLALGTAATVSAAFTDVGLQDTHTCTFAWDDGSSNTTVNVAAGVLTCSASRTYTAAGVYTVEITVTDDDNGSATTEFKYVVIYDPSAGFVTGGGWIDSPAGAYPANSSLAGKATFGFVSKYHRGATTPTGNTEFQFHVAGFNFQSTVYEWLVVAGARAQYKGTGTVNGAGVYGFLLTAIDGQQTGGGVDKFRIKIWNASGVVYDNGLGALDDADPQLLGGGSIVIHTK